MERAAVLLLDGCGIKGVTVARFDDRDYRIGGPPVIKAENLLRCDTHFGVQKQETPVLAEIRKAATARLFPPGCR